MTNGLSDSKVKWLTYLVYFLLAILSIVTAFNTYLISDLPKEYVRLERYKSDLINWNERYISDREIRDRNQTKIETKLDEVLKLIQKHMSDSIKRDVEH